RHGKDGALHEHGNIAKEIFALRLPQHITCIERGWILRSLAVARSEDLGEHIFNVERRREGRLETDLFSFSGITTVKLVRWHGVTLAGLQHDLLITVIDTQTPIDRLEGLRLQHVPVHRRTIATCGKRYDRFHELSVGLFSGSVESDR